MQFLASVGVILSLIFVGVQIQQSREIAIAEIYQQRTALLLQSWSFAVPAETEFRAWMKDRAGEPLNPDEKYALTTRYAARIAYWENNHFQYQIGLLPEEQWEASKNSIRGQANRRHSSILERGRVSNFGEPGYVGRDPAISLQP